MQLRPAAPTLYLRETLLACLVVALIFLNFGHVAVTASGDFRVTPDSWCGDPLLPNSSDHAPCHACRIGNTADLPAVTAQIAPVTFAMTPVTYAAPLAGPLALVFRLAANPRAPPAA